MKKAIRIELDKLKQMNFKEKREYLWEYYRIHLFITLAVLLFTYAVIDAVVLNPYIPPYLGVAVYGPFVSQDFVDETQQQLTDAIMPEEIRLAQTEKIYVTNFFFDEAQGSSMNVAMSERFAAMCMTNEIDIIIASKDDTITFAENEFLLDLSTVVGINYEGQEDKKLYQTNEAGVSYLAAIALDKSRLFANEFIGETEFYISVIISTLKQEQAARAINFILSI